VRWNYIAPTLLIVWIMSMFDKSNISLVMANPTFLDEMHLANEKVMLGWLASSLFLAYGIFAPVWGWSVTRYGARRTTIAALIVWALTCFWSGFAGSYCSPHASCSAPARRPVTRSRWRSSPTGSHCASAARRPRTGGSAP
jgi:MFS family permease